MWKSINRKTGTLSGFFSFVFLNGTAIMKIVRVEDHGLADSIMALSVYLFIKFPETIEDFRTAMWVIVCLFGKDEA